MWLEWAHKLEPWIRGNSCTPEDVGRSPRSNTTAKIINTKGTLEEATTYREDATPRVNSLYVHQWIAGTSTIASPHHVLLMELARTRERVRFTTATLAISTKASM